MKTRALLLIVVCSLATLSAVAPAIAQNSDDPPLRASRPRTVQSETVDATDYDVTGYLSVGQTTTSEYQADQYLLTQIFSNGSTKSNLGLFDTRSMAQDVGGQLLFGGKYTTGGLYERFAMIVGGKKNGTSGNYDGVLQFFVRNGSFAEVMRVDSTGLTVTGNITAGGTIYAKFQDIAEWVPADESIEAGTVVVVAPQNHVTASTDPYDTRVAGVVSAQPGLILGEAGDAKVLVATTGRVKVKVDASNGAIREGDILVSSAVKGTAMKSQPLVLQGRKFHQPGTVIGKALEPLDKGTGEILVLLSMQ